MFNHVSNPPNRFAPVEILWEEPPPVAHLEVLPDASRSVLSRNNSPDLGFDWTINPYRGCTHACAYCYARPYHEYLGYGAGSDFERKILVKRDAAARLREAFLTPRWSGELVVFSGATDCYQALERKEQITRACLEVCVEFSNPVQVITRSPLVARDVDVLAVLAQRSASRVTISVPLLREYAQKLEPGAPPPGARFRAMRALADAGIPVGVSISPLIPGLNDKQIPEILERARESGATFAWMQLVRLPGAVEAVFRERLQERLPGLAGTVLARLSRTRGGTLNDSRFFDRARGVDETWRVTEALFQLHKDRLGFTPPPPWPARTPFRRPAAEGQLGLFSGGAA